MKKYTILARSLNNPEKVWKMDEVTCNSWGEARQWAMVNCWQRLGGEEQMIVASPVQLKKVWSKYMKEV